MNKSLVNVITYCQNVKKSTVVAILIEDLKVPCGIDREEFK